jgi:hypothetical protein
LKYLETLLYGFEELGAVAFSEVRDYSVKDDRDGIEGVGCVIPPLRRLRRLVS